MKTRAKRHAIYSIDSISACIAFFINSHRVVASCSGWPKVGQEKAALGMHATTTSNKLVRVASSTLGETLSTGLRK